MSHAAWESRMRHSAVALIARAERVFVVSTVAPAIAAVTACSKHSRYPVNLPPVEQRRCDGRSRISCGAIGTFYHARTCFSRRESNGYHSSTILKEGLTWQ